jgi:ketosteroid isomerase-like protein
LSAGSCPVETAARQLGRLSVDDALALRTLTAEQGSGRSERRQYDAVGSGEIEPPTSCFGRRFLQHALFRLPGVVENAVMSDAPASTVDNVALVERFLAAFDRRWPTDDELVELVASDVRFVERPNLLNPAGSERDAAALRAGIERGRKLLAWQSYEVRDHVASGDTVVTRMRWCAELSADAGPWPAGTRLAAWCVGHYRLVAGRIVHIEQHDCYEQPSPPQGDR